MGGGGGGEVGRGRNEREGGTCQSYGGPANKENDYSYSCVGVRLGRMGTLLFSGDGETGRTT